MTHDVVCLRPEADFARVGALPPRSMQVVYRQPDDTQLPALLQEARAVVMPAVGPKLAPSLFEGSHLRLVQVTGAGVDPREIGLGPETDDVVRHFATSRLVTRATGKKHSSTRGSLPVLRVTWVSPAGISRVSPAFNP